MGLKINFLIISTILLSLLALDSYTTYRNVCILGHGEMNIGVANFAIENGFLSLVMAYATIYVAIAFVFAYSVKVVFKYRIYAIAIVIGALLGTGISYGRVVLNNYALEYNTMNPETPLPQEYFIQVDSDTFNKANEIFSNSTNRMLFCRILP